MFKIKGLKSLFKMYRNRKHSNCYVFYKVRLQLAGKKQFIKPQSYFTTKPH